MKTKTKIDNSLPDKLWELIQVALMDLTLAEMMEEYKIDMEDFHERNGKCSVCFAGSVIAAKENFSDYGIHYSTFQGYTGEAYIINRLRALNYIRKYDFNAAIYNINYTLSYQKRLKVVRVLEKKIKYVYQTPYWQNPELFKSNMEIAASILKKYDL